MVASTLPVAGIRAFTGRSHPLRRLGARLDDPPRGRRVAGTVPVFAVACLVGTAASTYTVLTGTNLDYGDAMAHLTISRRVLDSKAPGLTQLGTVWLPVPHLLLLPLVQSLWLFSTGIAACVLGSLCLGVTAAALYRVAARVGCRGLGRCAVVGALLANPSLLYVATTALTEPVLLATTTATAAGLAGWMTSSRRLSGGELSVFAGFPAALGVLTRYEAWALAMAGAVLVAIVVVRRGDGWRRATTYVCCFSAPPALAVGWWLAYNTAVYGDPLEFLTGEYSAAAFTETYTDRGQLTTKGNPGLSTAVLGWAMLETLGLLALVLAAMGLLVLTWRHRLDDRALLVWVLAAPTAFLLVSLMTGQHIMFNDASLPAGTYNNRYVLAAAPWTALLVGVLVHQVAASGRMVVRHAPHLVGAMLVTGLVAQNLWWSGDPNGRMSVLQEAANQHSAYGSVKSAARWLGEHYDGGNVLMDESSLLVAPVIGLPQDEFYNRSTGPLFDEALVQPYRHARWVFMHLRQEEELSNSSSLDRVTDALAADPQFFTRYRLVHLSGDIGVFRRVGDPS